jgi:uncharacterized SAM-binding protein YcdF (DUF218 family)
MVHPVRRALRALGSVSLVLVLGVVLAGMLPLRAWLGPALVVSDPLRPAEAIVVLSGGVEDADTLSAGTALRLVHGLRLWKRGLAPVLILTGGNPVDPAVPEAGVMARVALELGVPASALIVEREADRTAAQARAVAHLVKQRDITTVLLVTSPLHSYRAAAAFRKAGLDVVSAPPATRPGRARPIVVSPVQIYERLLALGPVVYEYVAIALYWWNGWL